MPSLPGCHLCKANERFLAFSEFNTGVSGEAIANRLLGLLESWQLPASNMVGQAYNEAGSMARSTKQLVVCLNSTLKLHTLTVLLIT